MGVNRWLVVFLPYLGMHTVTPFQDLFSQMDPSSFQFQQASDFRSDFDEFANQPWVMPCSRDHNEINHSIEPCAHSTSQLPSSSSQTNSVVENRLNQAGSLVENPPTKVATKSDLHLHYKSMNRISPQLHNNQPSYVSSTGHAVGPPQEFSHVSERSTSGSCPDTSEQLMKTVYKRRRLDNLEEDVTPKPINNLEEDVTPKPIKYAGFLNTNYPQVKSKFRESFKLVDFQPSTTIGHVAVEAVASLKEACGCNLIEIDIQKEGVKKMVQLAPAGSSKQSFYWLANALMVHGRGPSEDSKAKNEAVRPSEGKPQNAITTSKRSPFETFVHKLASSNNPKMEFYTKLSIKNHLEKRQNLFKELGRRYPNDHDLLKKKIATYDKMMNLLPVYLFYVDMINVMIPKEGSINEALIESQHNDAISNFLEFAKKLQLKEKNGTNPLTRETEESSIIKSTTSYVAKQGLLGEQANTFAWKAIHYWFTVSRLEFRVDEKSWVQGPEKNFKIFFKKLFESWIKNSCAEKCN